jgi:predicted GNAT superfamily acetyltransferase
LQFHRALGFIEIGTRTAASGKRLSMQVRDVSKQSNNA